MEYLASVLIVDDEVVMVMLLRRKIEKTGFYICDDPSTKKEAVEMVEKKVPFFVLMDIRLIGQYDRAAQFWQERVFSDCCLTSTK